MAMPRKLKLMNVFLNGYSYQGVAKSVTLPNPVKRGEQVIEQVTLMKPNAGTLRGVSLAAVANSEVDALIKVLPRITAPMLTEQEVAALELPDLVALAGKVVGFLSPNSVQ